MEIKYKETIKKHYLYILIILAITLVFYSDFVINERLPARDVVSGAYPLVEFTRQSYVNYKDANPLWNPYLMSGMPSPIELGFDTPLGYLSLIMNTARALKINFIIDVFLMGLFMYIFAISLNLDSRYALVSAIVYMLNGWIMSIIKSFHLGSLNGYAIMPLVMLFAIATFRKREWIKYSIITGILFGIMLHISPDLKVFLWTGLIFGVYGLFNIIGNNPVNSAVKVFMIYAIVAIICFGISAPNILFGKEYLELSSRAETSWEMSASRKVEISQFFNRLVEPVYDGMPQIRRRAGEDYNIGIIAFLLMCMAVYKRWKNRNVIYFSFIVLLSLFLVTGSFVYYLLWKYIPGFGSMRYLPRTLVIYAFAASVLAGYGISVLMNLLEKKGIGKGVQNAAYFGVVGLIILNLGVLGHSPYNAMQYWDVEDAITNNHILQYISEQQGIFRVQTWETRGIDHASDFYNVKLGLEHIYGYSPIWFPPYFNGFLGFSWANPAKFWGILNVKYITSMDKINVSGLRFVKEFEKCNVCFNDRKEWNKHYGPYLYENELFIPRAYITNNAILISGRKTNELEDKSKGLMYSIMSSPGFEPGKMVILFGEKGNLNNYDIDFLKKFKVIILTPDSFDQTSIQTLKSFIDAGGIILPDILKGETSLSNEKLIMALSSLNQSPIVIGDDNIITNSFERKTIKLDKEYNGFLVLSETYSLYNGWHAGLSQQGIQKEIPVFKANGVITAIDIPKGSESITLSYEPKSNKDGNIIMLVSIMLLAGYFVYHLIRKKKIIKEDTSN